MRMRPFIHLCIHPQEIHPCHPPSAPGGLRCATKSPPPLLLHCSPSLSTNTMRCGQVACGQGRGRAGWGWLGAVGTPLRAAVHDYRTATSSRQHILCAAATGNARSQPFSTSEHVLGCVQPYQLLASGKVMVRWRPSASGVCTAFSPAWLVPAGQLSCRCARQLHACATLSTANHAGQAHYLLPRQLRSGVWHAEANYRLQQTQCLPDPPAAAAASR